MMDHVAERFHATPEGQEARRIAETEWRHRQHEAWRQECVAEGRIQAHPTTRSE
jgi:hypothetical protein